MSPVLAEEWIGLKEVEDDLLEVMYGAVLLGWLRHQTGIFVRWERAERWAERREQLFEKRAGLHFALPCGPPPDGGDRLRSVQPFFVLAPAG